MPSPPQCRSDPAGSGALLYAVLDLGVELIAELTRCARDGVPLNFDEPPAAATSTADVQSGDFVLVIIQDDQIDKIATLSHVKLNEVTKEAVDDDDDEEHADKVISLDVFLTSEWKFCCINSPGPGFSMHW
jgi:hypothetical protein